MAQPRWNRDEALILLDALLRVRAGQITRKQAVPEVSDILRQMAMNQGQEIDETFRNTNGISWQMSIMEGALTGLGKTAEKAPRVFLETVALYKENPAEYEIRLQEAKEMAKLVPFEFDEAEPELPAEAPTVSVTLPVMATREAFALWLELVEGLKSGEAGALANTILTCEQLATRSRLPAQQLYGNTSEGAKATASLLKRLPKFKKRDNENHNRLTKALNLFTRYLSGEAETVTLPEDSEKLTEIAALSQTDAGETAAAEETQPDAGTEPAEEEAAAAEPVNAESVETETAEAEPTTLEPAETEPAGAAPVEQEPEESEPAEKPALTVHETDLSEQERFAAWLRDVRNLGTSSVKHYVDAISAAEVFAERQQMPVTKLYGATYAEAENTIAQIRRSEDFLEENRRQSYFLVPALQAWLQYLRADNAGSTEPAAEHTPAADAAIPSGTLYVVPSDQSDRQVAQPQISFYTIAQFVSASTRNREGYIKWLTEVQHLAPVTARNYGSAITTCERYTGDSVKRLYGVDYATAAKNAETIMQSSDFQRANETQHNRLTAALKSYLNYLSAGTDGGQTVVRPDGQTAQPQISFYTSTRPAADAAPPEQRAGLTENQRSYTQLPENAFSFDDHKFSEKSYRDKLRDFTASRKEFTLQELLDIMQGHQFRQTMNIIGKDVVRITETRFLRRDLIHFDTASIDQILDAQCPEAFIPVKDIGQYLYFPDTGYPWNSWLLESYLFSGSRQFKLVHANFSKHGVYGAMVRKDSGIKDYRSLLVEVLARSDALQSEHDALRYLVRQGYQKQAFFGQIAQVLQEARIRKEKLVNAEQAADSSCVIPPDRVSMQVNQPQLSFYTGTRHAAEAESVETEPAELGQAGAEPEEVQPAEAKPAEPEPAEPEHVESSPAASALADLESFTAWMLEENAFATSTVKLCVDMISVAEVFAEKQNLSGAKLYGVSCAEAEATLAQIQRTAGFLKENRKQGYCLSAALTIYQRYLRATGAGTVRSAAAEPAEAVPEDLEPVADPEAVDAKTDTFAAQADAMQPDAVADAVESEPEAGTSAPVQELAVPKSAEQQPVEPASAELKFPEAQPADEAAMQSPEPAAGTQQSPYTSQSAEKMENVQTDVQIWQDTFELSGIIRGINFDGVLNEKEILFLQDWTDRHRNLVHTRTQKQMIERIDAVLEDQIVTEEERHSLLQLVDRLPWSAGLQAELDVLYELNGIISGIVSDDVVNEAEIRELARWMELHEQQLRADTSSRRLSGMLSKILADNIVTESEQEELLQLLTQKISARQLSAKLISLRELVKARKNIGLELITLLDNRDAIARIHLLAEIELNRAMYASSFAGLHDPEIIFISLSLIAMLGYHDGNYYDAVREAYPNLYKNFSEQKIEGRIRSILDQYRTTAEKQSGTRIINAALRNAIVPAYYLPSFFEFIFDIYKINFEYHLPEDLTGEFRFVYDGLRNNLLNTGDSLQVSVTQKTYKLIQSTKKLIVDDRDIDAVIGLSIIIVRLIDREIRGNDPVIYNPYLKSGFDAWVRGIAEAEEKKWNRSDRRSGTSSGIRSQWEPEFVLEGRTVYLVPPVHRISAQHDYQNISIAVCCNGCVVYEEHEPEIYEIIGGYQIRPAKIRLDNPLGRVSYLLRDGDQIIYESGEKLYRDVIAFSEQGSEIRNNTTYNGVVIFCHREPSDALLPLITCPNFQLSTKIVYAGDVLKVDDTVFSFSEMLKPGLLGDLLEGQYIKDTDTGKLYSVYSRVTALVFEKTDARDNCEIILNQKIFHLSALTCQTVVRDGAVKFFVELPINEAGIYHLRVYSVLAGRREQITYLIFALDPTYEQDVSKLDDLHYQVQITSGLLEAPVEAELDIREFEEDWLKLSGRPYSYLLPLPLQIRRLNDEPWCPESDALWIGDVRSDSEMSVYGDCDCLQVLSDNGSVLCDGLKFRNCGTYSRISVGFLLSFKNEHSFVILRALRNGIISRTIYCYNQCVIDRDRTEIIFDPAEKVLHITPHWHGRGKVCLELSDADGQVLQRRDLLTAGQTIELTNIPSFVPCSICFYEKAGGLSLKKMRKMAEVSCVFHAREDFVGRSFKINKVYFDRLIRGEFTRKKHFFNHVYVSFLEKREADLFTGELFTNYGGRIYKLDRVNPVEIEICSDEIDDGMELAITHDGDGLYIDFEHHSVKNTLVDKNGIDIYSYIIEMDGSVPVEEAEPN